MRFNVFLATLFLATLAAGLVLPVTSYKRDVEVRQRSVEGPLEVFVREPVNKNKLVHTVAAGGGNHAQSWTHKEVKHAVKEANKVKAMSKTQQKKHDLVEFKNRPHAVPLHPGAEHAKPFPNHTGGKLYEFPLPNKNPLTNKSPARVIMKEHKSGRLEHVGVVGHDQSRAHGAHGGGDHFPVHPTNPHSHL